MRSFALPLLLLTAATTAGAVDFAKDIQPILEVNCVKCHGPDKAKGELRLDTKELTLQGGDAGPSVVAGKPDESPLLERVILPADHDDIMPPKGDPLTKPQQEALRAWIAEGAAWPDGVALVERDASFYEPDTKEIVSISVYPPDVTLETSRDHHRVVVVAKYADDTTKDVTEKAAFAIQNPALAKFEKLTFTPQQDGETKVAVSYREKTAEFPLVVKSAANDRPVSFRLDVMPVFMRESCNTGSCHGSARGQDGFMLSLFGYDPAGDYYRLTRELSGRRINLALPEQSMLIEKSIEAVPHSGGKLFEKGSDSYHTVMRWLNAGVPDDPAEVAKAEKLEIFPKQIVLEGEGAKQQMTVRAKYSDGTDRDVTKLAVFMSNNDPAASVDENGLVTANGRGEAFIMARFDTFTEVAQVIVIPKNLQYERPQLAEANYIDSLVHDKLHKLRIVPSGTCSDEVFLRRAFLDIIGVLPEPADYEKFMADGAADKRAKLIAELLDRKEFTELWVMKFAELLQIRTDNNQGMSYKATLLYFNWLQDKIANNVPFNEIVQDLLSSKGGTFTNPATNYYQVERDTLRLAENCAQVFMGMRLQCAQCHNHPFDQWTMTDYYGFASFFTQVGRKRGEDPRETIVFNSGGGEVNNPVTKQPVPPKFLGGDSPDLKGTDRREALAKWLASPENPFFAKNLGNLVWQHFFGVGIIDPVDDVRLSNPPSNPELLEALGKRFTEYNYDFKRLVSDICNSQTYQRASQANETNASDERNFSKALIRRQRAEVLLDTISQVTDTRNKFQGLPLGARAVQIADGNVSNYFLQTFGRAERATVCSCEVKMEPNLGQALHLINGDTTGDRIRNGKVVESLLAEGKPPAEILDNLYIRCFARKPTDTERQSIQKALDEAGAEKHREVLEDVFWALLNSKEFMFNH